GIESQKSIVGDVSCLIMHGPERECQNALRTKVKGRGRSPILLHENARSSPAGLELCKTDACWQARRTTEANATSRDG
ncbi:MAG: hypothetical protein AB7U61_12530, partial [Methylocystis sp.]